MKDWKYERVEKKFDVLPVGKYRIRIKNAEKAISKNSGNDMLVMTFEVSGSDQTLMYYIPFLAESPEVTNRMLTQMFDCFDIEDNNFNLASWIGKVGACQTKLEDYDGTPRAKVSFLIHKNKQVDLPPWQDGAEKKPSLTQVQTQQDDLPF